jgi:hypothetical protein
MTGLQSYAREPSPGQMPGGWADGKIPETQSQDDVIDDGLEEEDDLAQEILSGV